jgi:hypothetical protein
MLTPQDKNRLNELQQLLLSSRGRQMPMDQINVVRQVLLAVIKILMEQNK